MRSPNKRFQWGEFTPDGKLLDYKAKMDMLPDLAQTSVQFCASVAMLFSTLGGASTQVSKMNWVPQKGWVYAGGTKGVFAETAKADFKELYRALVGFK